MFNLYARIVLFIALLFSIISPDKENDHLIETKFHDSGQKREECLYHAGLEDDYALVGLCTRWYVSGRKSDEFILLDGKLHGPYLTWYESGTKRYNLTYKHGKQDVLKQLNLESQPEINLQTYAHV